MARKKQNPTDQALYDQIKEEIKQRVSVWPSAYASGMLVKSYKDAFYRKYGENSNPYEGSLADTDVVSTGLGRWFAEEWVNVCEKDNNGNYVPCGRQSGNLDPSSYPYCRPIYSISTKNTPKTVSEFSEQELEELCKYKRSIEQGVMGKPTRIFHDSVLGNYGQRGGNLYPLDSDKVTRQSNLYPRDSDKVTRQGNLYPLDSETIILRNLTDAERQQSSKQYKKYAVEIPDSLLEKSLGKTVYFGHNQYDDYTTHKDKSRFENYISRHQKRENWTADGIGTAGFWSRWLLWNKPSFKDSIRDIEKRFNVSINNLTGR
jgi:hypothetical protein